MNLYDFSIYPQNTRTYGGRAGRKVGITMNGDYYMLKYPCNLKNKKLKNITVSYSNSSVSEYIGSHIYELVNIPVHETFLGYRDDKLVVACKDIKGSSYDFVEFGKMKVTLAEKFLPEEIDATDGTGTDLDETIATIKNHPLIPNKPETINRFWDMFIIDAFIGNSERTNSDWGLLRDRHSEQFIGLAPVIDNGNCLNNKWDTQKMQQALDNENDFISFAFSGVTSIFEQEGKRINPFQYISHADNPDCTAALLRIVPRINMPAIRNVIQDMHNANVINSIQANFFDSILTARYEQQLYHEFTTHIRKISNVINDRYQ